MLCAWRPTCRFAGGSSTCPMALHRSPFVSASRTLRVFGFTAAYAFVMVTGTAILMAALVPDHDGGQTGTDGQRLTAAEVVMQRSAERGVAATDAFLIASRTISNDKRGF